MGGCFQQLPRHLAKFMHEKPCFMNQVLLKNNPETVFLRLLFSKSNYSVTSLQQPPVGHKKWLLYGGDRFGEVKYTCIEKCDIKNWLL